MRPVVHPFTSHSTPLQGEVVILNEFDPERTPLEALSGPGYKVAGPEEALRAVSPKRRSAQRSGSVRSMSGSGDGAGGIGSAGSVVGGGRNVLSPTEMRKERDRRLANDFKKITPRTQPSALETLMPAGGVTLRGWVPRGWVRGEAVLAGLS